MRTAEDRNPYSINILLQSCCRNHLRRLPEPGIDHFHSGIAECTSDDLCSAVMSIEPRFSYEDSDLSLIHTRSILANKPCKQTVGPNELFDFRPCEMIFARRLKSLQYVWEAVIVIDCHSFEVH